MVFGSAGQRPLPSLSARVATCRHHLHHLLFQGARKCRHTSWGVSLRPRHSLLLSSQRGLLSTGNCGRQWASMKRSYRLLVKTCTGLRSSSRCLRPLDMSVGRADDCLAYQCGHLASREAMIRMLCRLRLLPIHGRSRALPGKLLAKIHGITEACKRPAPATSQQDAPAVMSLWQMQPTAAGVADGAISILSRIGLRPAGWRLALGARCPWNFSGSRQRCGTLRRAGWN